MEPVVLTRRPAARASPSRAAPAASTKSGHRRVSAMRDAVRVRTSLILHSAHAPARFRREVRGRAAESVKPSVTKLRGCENSVAKCVSRKRNRQAWASFILRSSDRALPALLVPVSTASWQTRPLTRHRRRARAPSQGEGDLRNALDEFAIARSARGPRASRRAAVRLPLRRISRCAPRRDAHLEAMVRSRSGSRS